MDMVVVPFCVDWLVSLVKVLTRMPIDDDDYLDFTHCSRVPHTEALPKPNQNV